MCWVTLDNFVGGDPKGHPLEGNFLGIFYKGGYLVPLAIGLLLMVFTFAVERQLTIGRAKGKGNVKSFVARIRSLVASGNISAAIAECDKQKGSVANVVKAGLLKYNELVGNNTLEGEKKIALIQKDIEETTSLEMPMLEKNLVILATIASIATLIGLLGTVLGMITAFASMAQAGAPDSVGLANGIPEALIKHSPRYRYSQQWPSFSTTTSPARSTPSLTVSTRQVTASCRTLL